MSEILENRPTPETVYVSENGHHIYVEDFIGEASDEFYLVMVVPAENKDDMDAIGDELDSTLWAEMVVNLGLKPESEDSDGIEKLRAMFTK
ncbi:hypothetical protein [Vibrio sp. Vb0877]|uniref:hypothetical protein n=1 Tax=Vibrio sp. Vb0877 TaxID=2816073 RepID=UPI001A8D4452|nr:hypothetical protein [Vibrio sp. Vb0877]MBO0208686.1 hypothetical protein [Vibrio sp. Vb0877]